MPFLFQIGHSLAKEIHDEVGHIACTLGGVNYESRGSKGVLKGVAARGARNPLFHHHFFRILSDREAHRALRYANLCFRQPYVFGGVPTRHKGGDCSGYMSGIICRVEGRQLGRLFATSNWLDKFDDFGFKEGLGGGGIDGPHISAVGRADRPFPLKRGDFFEIGDHGGNVRWIQSRLNFAARGMPQILGGHPLHESGHYDQATFNAVKAFEAHTVRVPSGLVGLVAWSRLNSQR